MKTSIPRNSLILFSLRKYLKDFEGSLLVRGPPSCNVSWHFFFSCIASRKLLMNRAVVLRYSDANLFGKYLRYLGLLKLFSNPFITLDLSKKPENLQEESAYNRLYNRPRRLFKSFYHMHNIFPCANDIVHSRFLRFRTFLYVFTSIYKFSCAENYG